jgi:hypothetical protein
MFMQPDDPEGFPTRESAGVVPNVDAVEVVLRTLLRDDLDHAPFWKEVSAFSQMSQSQRDPYFGKYVAVYEGNIVDSDEDEGELALRFYRTFGYVPVYIHKVGIEDGMVEANE